MVDVGVLSSRTTVSKSTFHGQLHFHECVIPIDRLDGKNRERADHAAASRNPLRDHVVQTRSCHPPFEHVSPAASSTPNAVGASPPPSGSPSLSPHNPHSPAPE